MTSADDKQPSSAPAMALDEAGLLAARRDLKQGAMTPAYGPWRDEVVRLLNDALATELVCVLRYRRHHYTGGGLASPMIVEEFMAHANAELGHADRIAERIVQLGGEPDFNPKHLLDRSHAEYNEPTDLTEMIEANLVAERVAIESYRQMIGLLGDRDSTTRRLLEDILAVEEEHADELKDWLPR
jgi:bacterioferritin